jgi:hypothetical protein
VGWPEELGLSNNPHAAYDWAPPNAENLEFEIHLEGELLEPEYVTVQGLLVVGSDSEG